MTAGTCAALFWLAMCFSPWTGGNLPNTEVFINACVAWGFALWLRAPLSEMSWRRCAVIATLFALASLYKQVAVLIFLGIAVADLISSARAGRPSHLTGHLTSHLTSPLTSPVKRSIAMLALIVLVWCGVLGYFAITGRGWLAWQTLFVAPRAYSGGMAHNLAVSLLPQTMISSNLVFALPALALTIIGAMIEPGRRWVLLAGLFVGVHLAVALPGQFFPHYYQLWFVPLSIGAGWGAAGLVQVVPRKPLAYAVVALALLAMIAPQVSWYSLSGREWAGRRHPGFFLDAHDAFIAAAKSLPPDETFYTWSDEAYAYPITHRRPPATALWKAHTTTGPLAGWLTQRTLDDLKQKPPAMIILYGNEPGPAGHPILEWTRRHYELVPDERRRFFPLTIYVHRSRQPRMSSRAGAMRERGTSECRYPFDSAIPRSLKLPRGMTCARR